MSDYKVQAICGKCGRRREYVGPAIYGVRGFPLRCTCHKTPVRHIAVNGSIVEIETKRKD